MDLLIRERQGTTIEIGFDRRNKKIYRVCKKGGGLCQYINDLDSAKSFAAILEECEGPIPVINRGLKAEVELVTQNAAIPVVLEEEKMEDQNALNKSGIFLEKVLGVLTCPSYLTVQKESTQVLQTANNPN